MAPARDVEWRKTLLAWVFGLLVFTTVSGLAILWLPFGVPAQITVLAHTLVGVVLLLPFVVYQARHWRVYREARLTHVKLTGYLSLLATGTALVSGLVLTVQAAWGVRIDYAWDAVHIVATFAVIAALLPHVGSLLVRNRVGTTERAASVRAAERGMALRSALVVGLASATILVGVFAYRPVALHNALPDDYEYDYGRDRPFAPSLARTESNDAFDPRSTGGSASCGSSGCHEEILREWQVSAHRYSAMDPGFRAVQAAMGQQNGPASTRYCAGCHDPISLFAGTKNLFQDDLTDPIGLDEGVSCLSCHSITETDVQGNANYVVRQPSRYLYELAPEGQGRWVRDFLIRAYPRHHVETLSKRLHKSPDYCAACHKQFIDEEINEVGWVQLQNQFDNWRKSRWNTPGSPEETIECRECHMPLVPSTDPASGDDLDYNRSPDDGAHRSHRFLGANQFVPRLLELPGADEHVELVRRWLRGEIEIPEIADKWREGPAVPIEVLVPEAVEPGAEVRVRTRITNNKVGHDFPTGPLDIIQAWVEVVVEDDEGRVVFESGARDEEHFIDPGSFIFKAEPVDRYGNLIDRHNLWEMVGVRYRRALFPGTSDEAAYTFFCPGGLAEPASGTSLEDEVKLRAGPPGRLHVSARLLYRKFDQSLLNFLAGGESDVTSPVTVLSEDEAVIEVRASAAEAAGDG